jgi:hypothetical protein
MYFYNKYESNYSVIATSKSWSFFPSDRSSNAVIYGMPFSGNGPWWILSLTNGAVFQGPLALGLRCSELECHSGRKSLEMR